MSEAYWRKRIEVEEQLADFLKRGEEPRPVPPGVVPSISAKHQKEMRKMIEERVKEEVSRARETYHVAHALTAAKLAVEIGRMASSPDLTKADLRELTLLQREAMATAKPLFGLGLDIAAGGNAPIQINILSELPPSMFQSRGAEVVEAETKAVLDDPDANSLTTDVV